MSTYEHIFQPLTIRGMTIRNRVAMSPMGTNFAWASGEISPEHIEYYAARARGGTGLIIVENANVDFPAGSNGTTQLRIDQDCFIPGLYRLNEVLHRYGACSSLQINHAGSAAMQSRIGVQPVSASNIPGRKGGDIPRPLTKGEMEVIAERFAKAARRAQIAGFDSVEVHGGLSYLLNQFLSPLTNDRTDEFGGSMENRARFPSMVVKAVREAVGPMYPILMRLTAGDLMEGGHSLEDSLLIMRYFLSEVDMVDVTVGLQEKIQYQIDMSHLPDGWKAELARKVKDRHGIPVITVGNIRDPDVAEDILARGDADMVMLGRGLIADPDWVRKVREGRVDEIRKCISCNIGCFGHRGMHNRPIRCTINPSVYPEGIGSRKVFGQCNVAVIGGGAAGLEAACTAAEAGCTVFLFEKKDTLGGLAAAIGNIPDKKRIGNFPAWLINRAGKLKNLHIFTGTEATPSLVQNYRPDVVVLATGSQPLLPPIDGLRERLGKPGSKLHTALDMIGRLPAWPVNMEGTKIVVIGGGLVGLDMAEFFAPRGAEVTIVEMSPHIGQDLDPVSKYGIPEILNKFGVLQMVNTKLIKVLDDAFVVETQSGTQALPFDHGFLCLGMKADNECHGMFEDYCKESGAELYVIGDGRRARRIIDGVREGHGILDLLELLGFAERC